MPQFTSITRANTRSPPCQSKTTKKVVQADSKHEPRTLLSWQNARSLAVAPSSRAIGEIAMHQRFRGLGAATLSLLLASCARLYPAPTPLPKPTPALSLPAPVPLASPSPSTTPASFSVLYARDIQPQTSSQTCSLCHSGGGNAPQRALGTYAVDSIVNATRLRSMLWEYGHASETQLAQLDTWIKAGRPQTEIIPTPSPSPSPSSTPAPASTYFSPHASNWSSTHGDVVEAAGGVQNARITSGQNCASCHTTMRATDGSIPPSPGALRTCYTCHNGPGGP